MSSEIYEFDDSFFNDPFSSFNETSTIEILHALHEQNYTYTSLLPSTSPPLSTQENHDTLQLDESHQINHTLVFSSSPPSHQLENLSLYQMGISVSSSNKSYEFSPLEVKSEKGQLPLYDNYPYGGSDNVLKMMQRSYSSTFFQNGKSHSLLYQPKFDSLMESPILHSQVLTSSDHPFSSATHMRRVCSTGDLQGPKGNQTSERLSSSPLATESSLMEEANFKVGRYNAEEKKEKILRYRAKRTQRNFNKTIKYACRKTLADSRPRIRGRFARNDEPGEIPKTTNSQRYGYEDEFWMDGFHEDKDVGIKGRRQLFDTYPF